MSRRLSRDPDQLQLMPPRPLPVVNGRRMTEADVRRLRSRMGPLEGDQCQENGWHKHRDGHATFRINGTNAQVHRLVYLLEVGGIPRGYHVHHRCHNPGCCNPAHLALVTHSEHSRLHAIESNGNHAAAIWRARTHCQRCGHLLMRRKKTVDKRGYERQCPTCARDGKRASYQRRRRQQLLTTATP